MPPFPKCVKQSSKPSTFCPGCGHQIVLKNIGFAIDNLKMQNKAMLGLDIGCSLLAWDFFDIDSLQTHHGRTIPTIVGYKLAKPKSLSIAYLGDGGAYAIGAQHLVNSAVRDDNITVIVINNTTYAMTGGQEAPTTLPGQITATTPHGADEYFFKGPESVRCINKDAFIARTTTTNPIHLLNTIKKAFDWQLANKGFSYVEVLSFCPTNWKTPTAETTWAYMQTLEKEYKIGEINVTCTSN
ncbi:2-oxoglutarate synthase [Patescibacteria group bacterium]|nr:2-oxoglutarate synthase [Patescibacteria group bacterium]